jgi:PilZ domain-containing protein
MKQPGQPSAYAGPGARPNGGAHGHAQGHQVKRGNTTRSLTAEERRRAQRVLLRIGVAVQVAGKANVIQGQTHTVSENGAMLILSDGLPEGTTVTVENVKAQKKVEARVVRPSQVTSEGALVPIEFLAPSPSFWSVFFPPVAN